MGAEAILIGVAVGSALLPFYLLLMATVFCRTALRDGGEFEAEIKAPMRTLRVRARGAPTPESSIDGAGSEHGRTADETRH